MNSLVNDAMNDVEQFIKENSWIRDIKVYVTKWSIKLLNDWKSLGSFKIEEQLIQIKTWIDNVKNMEKTILTTNKVFKIDCSSVEKILVPRLDGIYNEICETIIQETTKNAQDFVAKLTYILKELDRKPDTIESFANYAKMAFKRKTNMNTFAERSNSIKGLMEVIRTHYRPLTTEEETLDSQSQELYKSFMYKLQESIEFVNSQTPNIMDQLNSLYKVICTVKKAVRN